MTNTKRHIDELYKTGKTTFRDDQLVHKDYVIEFDELAEKWAIGNGSVLAQHIKEPTTGMMNLFKNFATNELKQLCIDYYGEE